MLLLGCLGIPPDSSSRPILLSVKSSFDDSRWTLHSDREHSSVGQLRLSIEFQIERLESREVREAYTFLLILGHVRRQGSQKCHFADRRGCVEIRTLEQDKLV